jgi:integrase
MASVHKNPAAGSPYWFAAFRGPDGRRMKKSTKTKDRTKALRLAVEWEELANKGRKGELVVSQARKVVSELVEQATGEPLHFQSVSDYFTHWKKQWEGSKAKNTAVKYTHTVDSFLKALGKRSSQPLGNISPGDLEKWRDSLQKGGRTPTTVNFSLKVVSIAFQKALKLGYISVNPCHGLEAVRDDTEAQRDVFTQEQVQALLLAAKGTDWEGAVLVGYYTGLRLGDVVALTWGEVDTSSQRGWFLRRTTGKTKKVVLVPVHPFLQDFLNTRQGVARAPLFPVLSGSKPGGNTGLSTQFKKLMERAGIKGRILRKGGGAARQTSSLSFHSLRHSFASAMANAGVSEEVRMLLTGHSTRRAHKTYTHHEETQVWDAVSKIPSMAVP